MRAPGFLRSSKFFRRRTKTPPQCRDSRRAIVLVIVLVVVALLSLTAYTFTDLTQAHRHAAILSGKQIQTRMLVDSGVEAVKLYLMMDEATREEMGGHFDNPYYFQAAKVIPELDPDDRGSFTVVAPIVDEATGESGIRYGLEDESTRLNLNLLLLVDQAQSGAGRTLLMGIPDMTEDVADAILDWIDPDDEPREFGAEVDYYSGLSPAYAPRNGPPETVEELLLVAGVTPDLLFGVDVNRNGMVDTYESNAATSGVLSASSMTAGTATSTYSRGWASYLTLYSAEKNARVDGTPRIVLNGSDLEALKEELDAVFDASWTNFILAYRLYGPAQQGQSSGMGPVPDLADLELDLTQAPKGTFTQVLDLINAQVQMTQNGQNITLQSPFTESASEMVVYLPLLMENCTANETESIPGRININEAPIDILLGIPGMTEDIVNEITTRRTEEVDSSDQNRQYETWLLAEGIVTLTEMRALTPFINAGGDVFRAQIVGYYQGGGPSSRVEVIFDATPTTPQVLFWRDLSHLGRGFALETLGVDIVEPAQ